MWLAVVCSLPRALGACYNERGSRLLTEHFMPAIQRPNAVGLLLCRLVIVEEKTRNVSLANSFQQIAVESFPSGSLPFSVFTTLSDGMGETLLKLSVSRCDTLEEIYWRSLNIRFNNPLRQLQMWWRVQSCFFPIEGKYQFMLTADDDPIAQCTLKVIQKGNDHE